MRLRISLMAVVSVSVLAMLLNAVAPLTTSQGDEALEMRIETTMTISGLDPMTGSGSATLTYSGTAASLLRHSMFNMSGADANDNMRLEVNETRAVLQTIADAMVGKLYWGISIDTVTDFAGRSASWIIDHTAGLVDVNWSSGEAISFCVNFDGEGAGSTKTIEAAQGAYGAFARAVADATGYMFEGMLIVKQRVTALTVGSFINPDLSEGKMNAVRTPVGDIYWYSFKGEVTAGSSVSDSLAYESFSVKENQQIAFVVLFIGCILILRNPGKKFDKFEKLHPRKFRKYAKPLMSVRLTAYAITAVLIIIYVLPFAFGWASRNAMIYAAYLYILIPAAVIVQHFLGRALYDKASLTIPEESVIEVKQALVEPLEGEGEMLCKVCYRTIEAGLDIFQCDCRATMHVDCAERSQTCPSCGQFLFPQRTRSIQCRSCGETFLHTGSEDAYSIQCTKCGAFQEEIKPGKNYLILDEDPKNAFMMIRAMGLSGRPTLTLTSSFPGKIRADYDLGEATVKWLSDSTTDIDNINPKDLEGDAMEIVSTFLMTTKNAGVLIDGFEMLVDLNGFDATITFVKKLNDLAATHGSTIILSLKKKAVSEEQYKRISDAFDETHDYS